MKNLMLMTTLALTTLTLMGRANANIGGGRNGNTYNTGSYECEDQAKELQGRFSFGAKEARLTIKGQQTDLSCSSGQNVNGEDRQFFRTRYLNPSDVCVGNSAKGDILVGTTNSMGIIQMNAYLLDSTGRVKAESRLNCTSVPADRNSGW